VYSARTNCPMTKAFGQGRGQVLAEVQHRVSHQQILLSLRPLLLPAALQGQMVVLQALEERLPVKALVSARVALQESELS